jgi:hypothetical protein
MSLTRRRFVLAMGTGWIVATGCDSPANPDGSVLDGSGRDAPGPDAVSVDAPGLADASVSWDPGRIELVIDERTSVELSPTLPGGVALGGSFSVAPDGTPLPSGMSLDSSGTLLLGTAGVAITDGVVFIYEEP